MHAVERAGIAIVHHREFLCRGVFCASVSLAFHCASTEIDDSLESQCTISLPDVWGNAAMRLYCNFVVHLYPAGITILLLRLLLLSTRSSCAGECSVLL